MTVLAAASTLEKIKNVPPQFWVNTALIIGGIIVGFLVLRWIATRMNKFVLGIICFAGLSILGFSWIYNRNEPAFLTPAVDVIAQFFPSKEGYDNRQAGDPSTPGLKKSGAPTKTSPQKR